MRLPQGLQLLALLCCKYIPHGRPEFGLRQCTAGHQTGQLVSRGLDGRLIDSLRRSRLVERNPTLGQGLLLRLCRPAVFRRQLAQLLLLSIGHADLGRQSPEKIAVSCGMTTNRRAAPLTEPPSSPILAAVSSVLTCCMPLGSVTVPSMTVSSMMASAMPMAGAMVRLMASTHSVAAVPLPELTVMSSALVTLSPDVVSATSVMLAMAAMMAVGVTLAVPVTKTVMFGPVMSAGVLAERPAVAAMMARMLPVVAMPASPNLIPRVPVSGMHVTGMSVPSVPVSKVSTPMLCETAPEMPCRAVCMLTVRMVTEVAVMARGRVMLSTMSEVAMLAVSVAAMCSEVGTMPVLAPGKALMSWSVSVSVVIVSVVIVRPAIGRMMFEFRSVSIMRTTCRLHVLLSMPAPRSKVALRRSKPAALEPPPLTMTGAFAAGTFATGERPRPWPMTCTSRPAVGMRLIAIRTPQSPTFRTPTLSVRAAVTGIAMSKSPQMGTVTIRAPALGPAILGPVTLRTVAFGTRFLRTTLTRSTWRTLPIARSVRRRTLVVAAGVLVIPTTCAVVV